MDKGAISVKLDQDRLVHMCKLCKGMIHNYTAVDEHTELLFVHLLAFHHRLRIMAVKDQNTYTVCMSEVEQMAFRQVWNKEPFDATDWGGLIVRSILDKIDKNFHGLKLTKRKV